jgi:hypothetical protein
LLLDVLTRELLPGSSPPLHLRLWLEQTTVHQCWILASVIVDQTHAVYGSGMEAPSAAISPLGLVVDLIWHKVFTCMRRRMMARSSNASTCSAGVGSWTNGRGSKAVVRSLRCAWERESNRCGRESDRERRRGMRSTPPRAVLFIGGSTETIRCGSFLRTKLFNDSIPRSL